jgi:hypothetical protein
VKTTKGYELTEEQIGRRAELAHYLTPGPNYRRDIRDTLASLQYAETSGQVDYWLDRAEGMTYDYR